MQNDIEQNVSQSSSETKSGAGALIGSIIIIVILTIGSIYFFKSLEIVKSPVLPESIDPAVVRDAAQNNADPEELEAAIEAAADVNVDSDLDSIDAELDAAFEEIEG